MSHASLYPLTREQIVTTAASVEGMYAGRIETLRVLHNPLDVLAQQTVAAASMEDIRVDEWFAEVRHAAPFSQLDRATFESVLGMMSGSYHSEENSARSVRAWRGTGMMGCYRRFPVRNASP